MRAGLSQSAPSTKNCDSMPNYWGDLLKHEANLQKLPQFAQYILRVKIQREQL